MNIDKAITYAESIVRKKLKFISMIVFLQNKVKILCSKNLRTFHGLPDFMRGYYGLCMSLQVIKLFIIRQSITVKCFIRGWLIELNWSIMIMGFLFTLSSVADYRITGDEQAKQDGIEAGRMAFEALSAKR